MFFKHLELFGFKSFAKKTRLDFEPGVTAIVGPNGCGKSNLADAIKWVLGEQSVSSMRGTKMEDVIFHGADDVPPVGFAEVSLTISNQDRILPLDYEEITITRRLFRSGESEYLLNKVPVRLKDIQELLMDTGLGMPSYSLMEQGKVDQILSSRPQDRRDIFEEASGITKYKAKREEALRKLERTNENLQRISDIIGEVKRQIKSMERQVNRARRYKEELERLKEYELEVSRYQYLSLKKEKHKLQNEIEQLKRAEASLNAAMSSTTHTLEKTREDLARVEEEISHIQEQTYRRQSEIETANNKICLQKERITELTRRRDALTQQIQDGERKIAHSFEQIKEVEERLEAIQRDREAKCNFLITQEEDIQSLIASNKQAKDKISQDKANQMELMTQETRIKNELSRQQLNLANFHARLRRLNLESERTEGEFKNLDEKCGVVEEQFQSLESQFKKLTRQIWDLKSNLELEVKKKQSLLARLDELAHQITAGESSLHFLRELHRNYEGFSSGVRSILQARERQTLKIEGICGVLAELVDVLPPYRVAIEAALGEAAEAIVVETPEAAYAASHYLRVHGQGRACFIWLEKIGEDKEKGLNLKQTLGKAAAFVNTEPKYRKLIEYLLHNTFMVENIEIARQLLRDTSWPHLRLVTLNGELLTRATMIGGSLPQNLDTALLGRKERIRQAEENLTRLGKEKAELEKLKAHQESVIAEMEGIIQEKEADLSKHKIQLANKEAQKTNVETEKKRVEEELSVLRVELAETNSEIEQLQAEERELKQKLEQLKQKQQEIQDRMQANQDLIAENNQRKEKVLIQLARTKTELASVDREIEEVHRRRALFCTAQDEQKKALQAEQGELEDTLNKIEECKQQISTLQLQTKNLSQVKLNLQERLKLALQMRAQLSSQIQSLEEKLKGSQKQLDALREKRSSFSVQLSQLGYKQDSLKERMRQNYQVDLEGSLENVGEISPPADSIFAEIERLKAKLAGIGPVNLVAIEENEQLQKRYAFLLAQQEDLCRAQESLRKAITQINRTARQKFSQTFQQIQVSFKEYFRILFGGGDARLILLDENNILESGIEIVVRPPGKRLQNISLLSGGENALTAIALLFAIFKVKPSPFCILDEVDAPLDEANIDRFIRLLSEFIQTSQFIIITHNKKTINMADIMYGITMEKSGISKIVSVRLSEADQTPAREMASVGR